MTPPPLKKNPVYHGHQTRRVTVYGCKTLLRARKRADDIEKKEKYACVVCRDIVTGRYHVYRTYEKILV